VVIICLTILDSRKASEISVLTKDSLNDKYSIYYSRRQGQKSARLEFYDVAAKSYAIIASGEKALYANILLRKGVV